MIGNEPEIGDKVHHPNRSHPTKKGWLQANGFIVYLIYDDEEDDEPIIWEIVVSFGEGDEEVYFADQLEWTPELGGYWRVT